MEDSNKKRSRDEYEKDLAPGSPPMNGDAGVAATLARLREPDELQNNSRDDENCGKWTDVQRSKKKRHRDSRARHHEPMANKQGKAVAESASDIEREREKQKRKAKGKEDNRPAVNVAPFHKIRSGLKIGDLQALALYCLADGPSPQWISVRHHLQIRKVVVLMVPGLERGMFTGEIVLGEEEGEKLGNGDVSAENVAVDKQGGVHGDEKTSLISNENESKKPASPFIAPSPPRNPFFRNPDNFLPAELVEKDLASPLKPLAQIFRHIWPVKSPGDDKYNKVHSPLHAMLNSPLTRSKEESAAKGPKTPTASKNWENRRTPITSYIASADDLRESNYLLHSLLFDTDAEREMEALRRTEAGTGLDDGWVESYVPSLAAAKVPERDIESGSMTQGREILAMDCEMVKVSDAGFALARISIVSWDGTVIMDELVKPDLPIKDYVTPYSGMTAAKLDPITTTLADIHQKLLPLLTPTAILVGHSLDSDLTALRLAHPFVVDTSILYPHPRGPPLKSSLKWLAQKYLGRAIQQGHGATGHDSVEDARAALDLVKVKCEKGPAWGTGDAAGESIFKRLGRTGRKGAGAMVDRGQPARGGFGHGAEVCIGCAGDADVVEGVRRAVRGDPDGKVVRGGGVDFVWARLRDLEGCRGWSNEFRHAPAAMTPSQADPPTAPTTTTTINGQDPTPPPPTTDRKTPGDLLLHPPPDPSPTDLAAAVRRTVAHVRAVRDALPPCTLFVVYSGTGDPRPMARYHEIRRRFQAEFKVKKWDELTWKWGDAEEQGLRAACRVAREGLGFVCVS